jgi:hypothetical protein
MGLSFTIVAGPRQRIHSGVRVRVLVATFYCLRFEAPPTWRARSPYLYPPGTGWPSYTTRHWVPFSSPPTTRTATVDVFEPASTRGEIPQSWISGAITLGQTAEKRSPQIVPLLLAYFPCYLPIIARQRLGKHVPAVTNKHAIEKLLSLSFSMRSVTYQVKVGGLLLPRTPYLVICC